MMIILKFPYIGGGKNFNKDFVYICGKVNFL